LGFRQKITPGFIQKWVQVFKENGFKAGLKMLGWRAVIAIIVFYLIRDGILYILLPYFIAKGYFGF
tara:strand:+ start:431 stop:628 length:198 start_codon:yes stop_codon:yes gene_type:complete